MQIQIRQGSTLPLYLQICECIRAALKEGQLRTGEKLPSTRMLARQLGISRNTVVQAFEELVASGVIQGHKGARFTVTGSRARVPQFRNWRSVMQGSGYPVRPRVTSDPDGNALFVFSTALSTRR